MRRPMARCLKKLPSRIPPGSNSCAMRPMPWAFQRGAITAYLRVARTLADLDGREQIARLHIAEALSYRQKLAAFQVAA